MRLILYRCSYISPNHLWYQKSQLIQGSRAFVVEISIIQTLFSWPFNNPDTAKTRILHPPPRSPFVTNCLPPSPDVSVFFHHHQTHYVKSKNIIDKGKNYDIFFKKPISKRTIITFALRLGQIGVPWFFIGDCHGLRIPLISAQCHRK